VREGDGVRPLDHGAHVPLGAVLDDDVDLLRLAHDNGVVVLDNVLKEGVGLRSSIYLAVYLCI
jgi:hypothetical protein